MSRAFTIYWQEEGWEPIGVGNVIPAAGADRGFVGKIDVGDRIYVTNVSNHHLRLVATFTVGQVVDAAVDGKPAGATLDAREYLVPAPGTSSVVAPRVVPMNMVRKICFATGRAEVRMDAYGVDRQTMRAVRELTAESAELLQQVIDGTPSGRPAFKTGDWTEDELRAAVEEYLKVAAVTGKGIALNKAEWYRELSARYGRSPDSYQYRMQNISYVLAQMGREWVPGLMPASNVGANVAATIERLIARVEERQVLPRVEEAVATAKARGDQSGKPPGTAKPPTSMSTVTTYVRDPKVKAWVLDRARGSCEACGDPAPFNGPDGYPFLEVHHLRHLADGGSDTTTNAVAACPNCHRRLHYSMDARQFRDGVYARVDELVRE